MRKEIIYDELLERIPNKYILTIVIMYGIKKNEHIKQLI